MGRIYGINIDNLHNEKGIRKSLAAIVGSSTVIVPDPSIFPTASELSDPQLLTTDEKTNLGETLGLVTGILTEDKTRVYEGALKIFKKRAGDEVNPRNPLKDLYLTAFLRINSLAPARFSSKGQELFYLFREMLSYLDRELDIRQEEDPNFALALDNLAFTSTLAASDPKGVHTLVSRDGPYPNLFDALFKIASSILKPGKTSRNRIGEFVLNPNLRLAQCNLQDPNQPYYIARDKTTDWSTSGRLLQIQIEDPKKQREINEQLSVYLNNINLSLLEIQEGKILETTETLIYQSDRRTDRKLEIAAVPVKKTVARTREHSRSQAIIISPDKDIKNLERRIENLEGNYSVF